MNIPGKLKYEVKRMFENTGIDEFSGHRKTGSINTSALASVATGNVRVFKRRTEQAGVDSAVVIVLDVSGSMSDKDDNYIRHMQYAIETTAALLETLAAAGVATSVVLFAGSFTVMKPWGMNHKRAIERLLRINMQGNTNDYECIRYAHGMLARRPEQRKVCFVVTDGGGDNSRSKLQVASGERMGITSIGIGIQSSVKEVFPNNVMIRKTADLGTASFKQIKLAA